MSESNKAYNNDHVAYVNEQLKKSGEYKDWEPVTPSPNTLQLDFDSPSLPANFVDILDMLRERVGKGKMQMIQMFRSRSGNIHVLISMSEDMTDLERVAWQAAFGSDPKREAGHLLSLSRAETNPILLIMRKDRNGR